MSLGQMKNPQFFRRPVSLEVSRFPMGPGGIGYPPGSCPAGNFSGLGKRQRVRANPGRAR